VLSLIKNASCVSPLHAPRFELPTPSAYTTTISKFRTLCSPHAFSNPYILVRYPYVLVYCLSPRIINPYTIALTVPKISDKETKLYVDNHTVNIQDFALRKTWRIKEIRGEARVGDVSKQESTSGGKSNSEFSQSSINSNTLDAIVKRASS
jgi:hypothetical protein